MNTQEQFDNLRFSIDYHKPGQEIQDAIEEFRINAKSFAADLFDSLPISCRERSVAITHLEDCVMWVIKGMVLEEARNANAPAVSEGSQA